MTTENSVPQKQCSRCREYFEAKREYWYKHKNTKDGFHSECKICTKKDQAEYRLKNSDKEKERIHRWAENNKKRRSATGKQHYQNNKEKVLARTNQYNRDNAIEKRQRDKIWYENNREKNRAKASRRRARKQNCEGSHTEVEIRELFQFQNRKCFHCNTDISEYFEADHWIPISRGGSDYIENIRLLCRNCNRSKKDKLPHEWNSKYSI